MQMTGFSSDSESAFNRRSRFTSFTSSCGNGISGDGCSGSCKSEAPHSAVSSSEGTKPTPPSATPPSQQTSPPIIVSQAKQGIVFIGSPNGKTYKEHLTRSEGLELEIILNKLNNGRRLTDQEREWAENLFRKLEEAKFAERTLYTDLLKEFISTPISSDVVEEKDLKASRLVDVQVPVAIEELKRAIDIIHRGELKSQVNSNIARLKRQGIDFSSVVPIDYEKSLESSARPIEVFAMLKTLKESAESFATASVPDSLDIIRSAVSALRDALPIFEQEYGIDPEEIESLLASIETVSFSTTKLDTEGVVAAVNRLLSHLEREKIFSAADIASLELRTAHTAAVAKRLMDESEEKDMPTDIPTFVDQLSSAAPEEARPAFERGSDIAQRVVLLQFLEKDERMTSLRAILRKDGRKDFDDRFNELKASIARVGTSDNQSTMCDDSMQDALRCSSDYLSDLQEAVRSRSFFTRLIGKLQDYFNVGS